MEKDRGVEYLYSFTLLKDPAGNVLVSASIPPPGR
jgi:hypothetical protein